MKPVKEDPFRSVRWEACYREGRIPWDRGAVSAGFRLFLEAGVFPKEGRILVPGCGRGYEVLALAAAGYAVTAVDVAPTPLAHLRQRLAAKGLAAEVVHADLLRWRPPVVFDAVFEQTCLCAFPPPQWADYERAVFRLLKPGGRLLILFMQTGREGGPPWHLDMAEMKRLFAPSRWEWQRRWPPQPVHTPPLEEIPWLLIRKSDGTA